MTDPLQLARAFVDAVDVELPGLVSRVLLTGSAGTDDWRQDRSDIDLVVVISRPLDGSDVPVLARLHADSRNSCTIDGIYLTEGQLATGPDNILTAPQSVDGRFDPGKAGAQLTWVTWLELESGRTLDGRPVDWDNDDTARKAALASRSNLDEYWRPLAHRARLRTRLLPGRLPAPGSAVAWIVLGPPRLVMTIESGVVATKTEAGRFAAEQWPQFSGLIERVLQFRATGEGRFSVADSRAGLALLDECADRGSRYS